MTSVRETIYGALVTALNTITTGNGYNLDIGPSGAQKVLYKQSATQPYVVASIPLERKQDPRASTQSQYIADLNFSIGCYPEEVNEDDAVSVEDRIAEIAEDVQNLLLSERAKNPALGVAGVQDIFLDEVRYYFVGDEVVQGCEITGRIEYRHPVGSV